MVNQIAKDMYANRGPMVKIDQHGSFWIMKDLMYTSAQIIRAWVTLTEYTKTGGKHLTAYKEFVDLEFALSFTQWQKSSRALLTSLKNSFETLHHDTKVAADF